MTDERHWLRAARVGKMTEPAMEASMLIACGIWCLLLGLVGLVGQGISALHFPTAQRLGLQERHADALSGRLELATARWDLVVLWTLPLAGLLMLLGHAWWPVAALVAGGIHLDAGGREMAKLLALRAGGVVVGSAREVRIGVFFLGLLSLTGLWAVLVGILLGFDGVR